MRNPVSHHDRDKACIVDMLATHRISQDKIAPVSENPWRVFKKQKQIEQASDFLFGLMRCPVKTVS